MGPVGSIQQLKSNVISWNLEGIDRLLPGRCSKDFIVFGITNWEYQFYFSFNAIFIGDKLLLRLCSSKEVSLQLDIHVNLQYEKESKDFSITNLDFIGKQKELSTIKPHGLLRITCTFLRIEEIVKKFVKTDETSNCGVQAECSKVNHTETSSNADTEQSAIPTGNKENNAGKLEVSKNLRCTEVIASNSELEEPVKTRGLLALSGNLKDIFLDEEESDVIINVGDQKYPAHKVIIRARSPVFYAMLKHDMKEKLQRSVEIKDCDPHIFKDFLLYLYTGKLDCLSNDNVFELYHMSDKYQVNELKMDCIDFIFSNLSVEIVCDVLSLAIKHCERDLLKHATNFFIENAKDILLTVNWQTFVKENPIEANELFIKTLNNVS